MMDILRTEAMLTFALPLISKGGKKMHILFTHNHSQRIVRLLKKFFKCMLKSLNLCF